MDLAQTWISCCTWQQEGGWAACCCGRVQCEMVTARIVSVRLQSGHVQRLMNCAWGAHNAAACTSLVVLALCQASWLRTTVRETACPTESDESELKAFKWGSIRQELWTNNKFMDAQISESFRSAGGCLVADTAKLTTTAAARGFFYASCAGSNFVDVCCERIFTTNNPFCCGDAIRICAGTAGMFLLQKSP